MGSHFLCFGFGTAGGRMPFSRIMTSMSGDRMWIAILTESGLRPSKSGI